MTDFETFNDKEEATLKIGILKEDLNIYCPDNQSITLEIDDVQAAADQAIKIIAANFAKIKAIVKKVTSKFTKIICENCIAIDASMSQIGETHHHLYKPTSGTPRNLQYVEDPEYASTSANLRSVCFGPGSGEKVYSATAEKSLDEMLAIFPNVKEVQAITCGFLTGEDLTKAKVAPGVESRSGDNWQACGKTRADAHLISQNGGNVNYGGTPPDADLISFFQAAKEKGLNLMLNPMLMVDSPDKPWRGDMQGDCQVTIKWFQEQYAPWILQYAELTKDYVDSFLIGSELKKITATDDGSFSFPIVHLMIELASKVKEIFRQTGRDIKVSYGADWSEYHHADNGRKHLDPLWSSEYIDFVGISAYFPITREFKANISVEQLKEYWRKGNSFDCYYDGEDNQHMMDPKYGYKAIEHWWNNTHFEDATGKYTSWQPKSKPIIFAEFGCASIDRSSNAPNVFASADGKLNGWVPYSREQADDRIYKRYLRASLETWNGNPCMQSMYAYSWDARGSDWYKNDYWADRGKYSKSHCLEGRFISPAEISKLNKQLGL